MQCDCGCIDCRNGHHDNCPLYCRRYKDSGRAGRRIVVPAVLGGMVGGLSGLLLSWIGAPFWQSMVSSFVLGVAISAGVTRRRSTDG